MNNIAIKVQNLGKKYLIKHEQKESYQTFQDMLLNGSNNVINSLNPFNKNIKNRQLLVAQNLWFKNILLVQKFNDRDLHDWP